MEVAYRGVIRGDDLYIEKRTSNFTWRGSIMIYIMIAFFAIFTCYFDIIFGISVLLLIVSVVPRNVIFSHIKESKSINEYDWISLVGLMMLLNVKLSFDSLQEVRQEGVVGMIERIKRRAGYNIDIAGWPSKKRWYYGAASKIEKRDLIRSLFYHLSSDGLLESEKKRVNEILLNIY